MRKELGKLRKKITDQRGDQRLGAKANEISKEIGRIQHLRALLDEPMEISRSSNGNVLRYRIPGRDEVVPDEFYDRIR